MKWHNTKFMLRHMKIIVGLMTILTAVALGFVLHLASGVFIPLVIAWFLLQIFRPVLKLGDQLKLPPFLKIALVFVLLFCMTLIGVRFVASQAVEFGEVYQRFYPDLEPTIEKFTNTLMTLGFLPNSRSSVRSEEQEEEDVPRNTFILTAAASPDSAPPALSGGSILMGELTKKLRTDWTSYVRYISEMAITLLSKLVLSLVFLMFMLLEAPYVVDKIDEAFRGPSARTGETVKSILATISSQISSYLGALTLISVATGLCAWVILTSCNVELATGWAVLTILLNFIPTVGSIIATVPPVVMAILQSPTSLTMPLLVLVLLTAVQVSIGNILTPKIMGDRLGLSPVIILLSLLLWGVIWGIPGAILSTPIASILQIICASTHSLKPIAILMGSGENARKARMKSDREAEAARQQRGEKGQGENA